MNGKESTLDQGIILLLSFIREKGRSNACLFKQMGQNEMHKEITTTKMIDVESLFVPSYLSLPRQSTLVNTFPYLESPIAKIPFCRYQFQKSKVRMNWPFRSLCNQHFFRVLLLGSPPFRKKINYYCFQFKNLESPYATNCSKKKLKTFSTYTLEGCLH